MNDMSRLWRVAVLCVGTASLAACASLPENGGRSGALQYATDRGLVVDSQADADTQHLVHGLLDKPISADDAIRIGLLANARVRSVYARLGIAGADVYDAGRLSNPSFSISAGFGNANADDKVTFGLAQNFLDLLLLPSRTRLAEGEFIRVQQEAAQDILNLAAEIETAYYRLVAAEQIRDMRQLAAKSTNISAELAGRFFVAGNMNRLDYALQKAAAADMAFSLRAAETAARVSRYELNRLMGQTAAPQWAVSARLPEPLDDDPDIEPLIAEALDTRLDLASARKAVEVLADSLKVTRQFRWLGSVAVGVDHERESGGKRITGPSLSLALPIFNQGQGAVHRAEAQVTQAEAAVHAMEATIANTVRSSHAELVEARQRALDYRDTVLPLRQEIVSETQKRVNFMIVGVFDLIDVKREEYNAYQGYFEAIGDYWVARATFARHIGLKLKSAEALSVIEETIPNQDQHHGHHGQPMPTDDAQPVADHTTQHDTDAHQGHGEQGGHDGHDGHGEHQ